MLVTPLFSVCSWKWERICRLVSPFCVQRLTWDYVDFSPLLHVLEGFTNMACWQYSPETFRTLGELGEQLGKKILNVLCEAMSTNRSIQERQWDIVLCALAFKQYGEEQRGKEEWRQKRNEGVKVGSKVIQDVQSSLFVLKLPKLWIRAETRWKMQHMCRWHFLFDLLGAMQINAGKYVNLCTRQQPAGFVYFHSNLILEDVTSLGCSCATPNPKITIRQQPKPKWWLWFKRYSEIIFPNCQILIGGGGGYNVGTFLIKVAVKILVL